MAYEQKDNSGSLFKNDKKEKDTHPDYKGTVKIGGVEYWQNAWVKETNGRKYFSQSFTPKDAKPQSESKPDKQSQQSNEPVDDGSGLPF